MRRYFFTYQLRDLFGGRMKWLLLLAVVLTLALSSAQFYPAFEFGKPYQDMMEQLKGPFTSETDNLVASWNSLHQELSNAAYEKVEKQWIENATSGTGQGITQIDPEIWEDSQEVLQGKGSFGKTVYDDLLLLSKAVSRYQTLRNLPGQWEEMAATYERNSQRTSDPNMVAYWTKLAEKSRALTIVKFYNMDGVECFLIAFSNDWLLLLLLLICVVILFSKDYKPDQYLILSSTPRWGRKYLSGKIQTLVLLTTFFAAISLLLQGLLMAISLQHFQALLQPVQAVAGLEGLLYPMPVWTFLVTLWGFKWLIYLLSASIAALVALLCKRLAVSLASLGVLLGGHFLCSYILSQATGVPPIHLLTLFSLEGITRMGEYLPVFGTPVPVGLYVVLAAILSVAAIFTVILWLGPRIIRLVYQHL